MLNKYINQIICGDCLEVMKDIHDKSIDMILCDLPYGTTACKWDTVIPFEPLWAHYKRIIKDNGAIVLTASQPFTTSLIASNMVMFKYEWIWDKKSVVGFANAKKMPLKHIENILVFYSKMPIYNPQNLIKIKAKKISNGKTHITKGHKGISAINGGRFKDSYVQEYTNYPKQILEFPREKGEHPTQKPVALFEYLIRTYTNEGDTVLDNCIGSGTTAVAALNTGRFFIGIEREPQYVEIARRRVEQAQAQQSLFA